MMNCFGEPRAFAAIRGGRNHLRLRGRMEFYPHRDGTLVVATVRDLPESATNFFALHIHEGRSCDGIGFPETGGHYNPEGTLHPMHAGDLPPLLSCDGRAFLAVVTNRFLIRDIIGRTVIIHSHPDDFTTQPSGNAGEKIACGVIRRV